MFAADCGYQPGMSAAKSPVERGFAWLWRRPWFRRAFYNGIGIAFRGNRRWRMMNCGWVDPDSPSPAGSSDEAGGEGLYLRMVDGVSLEGRHLLEIGSGRGGGCLLLHERFRPARMVGLDYAGASVRWCRRQFAKQGIEFHSGSALATPFPNAGFDVVLCVELTHCIPDKPAFLAEMARLLKPGGTLLVGDFFYRREDATHALLKFRNALVTAPFAVKTEEDLTSGVLAAIRADASRREALISEGVPSPLRGLARYFGGSTESSTYQALESGRAVYLRFQLERRATS